MIVAFSVARESVIKAKQSQTEFIAKFVHFLRAYKDADGTLKEEMLADIEYLLATNQCRLGKTFPVVGAGPGIFRTPLHYAAELGQLAVVKLLLEKKFKVEVDLKIQETETQTPQAGMTALHYAALHGHSDVAEYLLKKEANVLLTDNLGSPTTYFSVASGSRKMMNVIFKATHEKRPAVTVEALLSERDSNNHDLGFVTRTMRVNANKFKELLKNIFPSNATRKRYEYTVRYQLVFCSDGLH